MHFPNPVPIVVPRPFVGAMIDLHPNPGDVVVAFPIIGVDDGCALGKTFHLRPQRGGIGAVHHAEAQLMALPSDGTHDRHQVIGIGAMAFDSQRPAAG